MELIRATDLSIGHPGKPLAQGISFALQRGEILAVLGPNGAGKTTLFRTLLGLIPPLSGDIRLHGADLRTLSRPQIARAMAYVPQAMTAPFPYTLADFVLMGRTAHLPRFGQPSKTDLAAVVAALTKLDLLPLAGSPVNRLSGGERQLALIARALAQGAPLIVLDEPAASLDYGNRLRLLVRMRDLATEGTALILSTHEPDHAARLATRILSVDRVGQVGLGSPEEMTRPAHLAHLYSLPHAEVSP